MSLALSAEGWGQPSLPLRWALERPTQVGRLVPKPPWSVALFSQAKTFPSRCGLAHPSPSHLQDISGPSQLMRPFFRTAAQTFPHWIMPDVVMVGIFFLSTAQTMIKEAILPGNAQLPRRVSLPAFEQILHHRLAWKTQQCMEMIRHEKPERDMPLFLLVIESCGIQQSLSDGFWCELITPTFQAVDGHKKQRAIFDPMGHVMVEFLPVRHFSALHAAKNACLGSGLQESIGGRIGCAHTLRGCRIPSAGRAACPQAAVVCSGVCMRVGSS